MLTVLKYIAEQRNKLAAKHVGETFVYGLEEEAVQVRSRSVYDILSEIDGLQGLNVRERAFAAERYFRECV